MRRTGVLSLLAIALAALMPSLAVASVTPVVSVAPAPTMEASRLIASPCVELASVDSIAINIAAPLGSRTPTSVARDSVTALEATNMLNRTIARRARASVSRLHRKLSSTAGTVHNRLRTRSLLRT